MTTELNEKELEEIVGGKSSLPDDGKLFNIQCLHPDGLKIGANLKGVHGTAAKDKVLATMEPKGWKCTVTALN